MILILSLTACLNSNKVKRLNVPSDEGVIALCPGEVLPLKVNAKMRNGKRKSTTESGRDNLNWKHLEMRLDGQPMSYSVAMPLDPSVSWQRPLSLKVWLADRPEVSWEGQVVARYDCNYVVDLRGYPGQDGLFTTRDGRDGSDGDTTTGDRGEEGGDAQNGAAGEHGSHGNMGPQARVYLVESTTAEGLLEARVELAGSRESWTYLMLPGASSLLLDVSGGAGGAGGPGQDGGQGGAGGDGPRKGRGGDGGNGGDGGDGGDGGQGGSAELIVDPSAQAWSDSITLRAQGGPGGLPGEQGYGGRGGAGDPEGEDGVDGRAGRPGRQGQRGETLPVQVTTVTPGF